jgi:hypoxanthine-guanine phosphoribosyltransferase
VELAEIRERLRRTPWNEFPPVAILADVPRAKSHPSFAAAKAGDAKAAESVVEDTLAVAGIEPVRALIRDRQPYLLPVHAVEEIGMNAIPRAFARTLAIRLDLPLRSGVIQMNRVSHTGAGGYHRLAFPPVFEGDVEALEYVVVDDFVGQGGTLANLRGYLESNGGRVLGAVTLTGKAYSSELRLRVETLEALRKKHGQKLEEWWLATFGYGFDRLTESEAKYLIRSNDADTASARIAAARGVGD